MGLLVCARIQNKMYQNQVRNFGLRELLLARDHSRSLLPSIFEERCQYNVPDINLECEESIDNWDDLEVGLYSPVQNEKILGTSYSTENFPNEQGSFKPEFENCISEESNYDQHVLLLESQLIQNLLEVSKNSNDEMSFQLDRSTDSTESLDKFESELCFLDDGDNTDLNANQNDSIDLFPQSSRENEVLQSLPIYTSSPRSSSPSIINVISYAEYDFTNYRSVSPLIVRSPTPLSSRSSSPRMFRSPSPLEFLEHSFSELPIDDANDILFYNDSYLRGYSPVLFGTTDQQVPDANTEFQHVVTNTAEFPSFRNYVNNRTMSSCQDQVVPEFIEE